MQSSSSVPGFGSGILDSTICSCASSANALTMACVGCTVNACSVKQVPKGHMFALSEWRFVMKVKKECHPGLQCS